VKAELVSQSVRQAGRQWKHS